MITKQNILHTLQLITAVLIGIEVSLPPNPYKIELILCMILIICLKFDIVDKINERILQKYKVDNKDNLNRRINQLKKVIQEPDKYNINLTSRDNMLMLSGSVEELNKQVNALNSRIDGLSYLVNQLVKKN